MKRVAGIAGLVLIGLLILVVGGGYVWFRMTLRQALPKVSGELEIPGLKEPVEIIRDAYGVPHIYARNEPDLYLAFGFAMAQDRLWQMDFYRRLGSGRLSEVFGKDFVSTDRYFRLISAAGIREEVPHELAFLPEAFARGVNACMATQKGHLPLEFKILRYDPEPWGAEDYLAVLKVINWGLSAGWRVDLTASRILQMVGEERMREAFPPWPDGAPLIVPERTVALAPILDMTQGVMATLERLLPPFVPAASNNWVVSGARSQSGRPMFANDTHLPLTNPSFWWEVHLVCPTLEVSGFAPAGVPGIPIGRNRHVAWGITNVMVDDVDFYIEEVHPQDPTQYRVEDHWEKMRKVEEVIRVKGAEPVRTTLLLTRNGPVVSQPRDGKGGETISARWAFSEGIQPARAAYLLSKAKDMEGLVQALRFWELPSQNFVFADTEGNIGYWCCAMLPKRPKGDGLLPVPGWDGTYRWKGYVSFEERPHLLNPVSGFVATANNKVAGKDYPYPISCYWEPSDRIRRIVARLSQEKRLSPEDFRTIQADQICPLASELNPFLLEALEGEIAHPAAARARTILSGWDFSMGAESVAATLSEMTHQRMLENIFKDEMGEELFSAYLKTVSFPDRALRRILQERGSLWVDDVNTPERETLQEIVSRSLKEVLEELTRQFGEKVETWTWGRVHTLNFEHVLGKRPPLDRIFNLGPYPVGGNALTVDKKQYDLRHPYGVYHGVSQRIIVDLSRMEEALHVLPTGESGQLGSPHHEDQIPLYLQVRYHPSWLERRDVESQAEARLILKPSGG